MRGYKVIFLTVSVDRSKREIILEPGKTGLWIQRRPHTQNLLKIFILCQSCQVQKGLQSRSSFLFQGARDFGSSIIVEIRDAQSLIAFLSSRALHSSQKSFPSSSKVPYKLPLVFSCVIEFKIMQLYCNFWSVSWEPRCPTRVAIGGSWFVLWPTLVLSQPGSQLQQEFWLFHSLHCATDNVLSFSSFFIPFVCGDLCLKSEDYLLLHNTFYLWNHRALLIYLVTFLNHIPLHQYFFCDICADL